MARLTNCLIFDDKSIANVFDDGTVHFYPNLKSWKKPRENEGKYYVWQFGDKQRAIDILYKIEELVTKPLPIS